MTDNPSPILDSPSQSQQAGNKRVFSLGKVIALAGATALIGLLAGGAAGYSLRSGEVNALNAQIEDAEAETAAVAEVETAAEEEEPVADEPERSERGNIIKRIGESGGLGDKEPLDMAFTVTAITVDPQCTAPYAEPSKYGHLIRIDMTISTTSAMSDKILYSNVNDAWEWVKDDGTTANQDPGTAVTMPCLGDGEELPGSIGPGESQQGAIILDVPTAAGTLVFTPHNLGGGSDSWEWAVPAQ